MPCAPLFPKEANEALECFNSLRMVDAIGSPPMGEVCRQWVFEFVASIFGAYDADTGRRLIREFFLLIAKKNGKSTIAAGIMLVALLRNWRKSAEFIILAPTIEVAGNSFGPVRDMIRSNDELAELLHIQEHIRTVTHRETGATLKVVAADSQTVSGKKAVGVLIDELWEFGKRANAENMIREATGGLASRPEGFVIALSTMSDEPPAGVFKQWLLDYRAIRDGEVEDKRRLGVLYEFPPDMLADQSQPYLQRYNWYITNPNLGASVDPEFLADQLQKAIRNGQNSVIGFAAKHLNVEIGVSLGSSAWAGAEFWQRCADSGLTLDALLTRCDVVVVGIDGGGLDDMLGLTVLGRERDTGRWLVWSRAWAHKIVLDRRKEVASRLLDFERDGHLTIVDAPGDDVEAVADIVMQIEESGLLAEKHAIAVDAAGIGDIVDALTARGIAVDRIIGIQQGWKLTGAIKTTERKLAGGEMSHDGSPLMAWCVGNAKVEPRGNAITITKQTAGSAKIDPVMSLFDAVSLMATNPQAAVRANPEIIYL